jgi:transcriptional regulator PpsR
MNLHSTSGHLIPFNDPDAMFEGFSKDDFVALAYCAGDFVLGVDEQGIIRDLSANAGDRIFAHQWVGKKWLDTVTIESRPKIEQLLDPSQPGGDTWRQVNHPHDGEDVPVSYRVITPKSGGWRVAIGRDLRPVSVLQQRLLKTQQSMERDYLNLRQTETRYRLLFDNIAYPVLISDADSHEIQQANAACHMLIRATPGSLEGRSLLSLIDVEDRDVLVGYLGAVSMNASAPAATVRLAGADGNVQVTVSAFRQSGKRFWLVSIDDGQGDAAPRKADRYILDVVERMPDAFVLADEKQAIVVANRAFAELVQAGSVEQLLGAPLGRFIGRPDVDLGLLKRQLKDHQHVRNFGSIIHDLNGGEEPVEISAIMVERDQPLFGYSVRSVGRRERDLPPAGADYPRSVEQLTELIGRKTLKEIVRESTDLIERMCIEAALDHTSDNRASAAEILGLSRQSLYSKLHRHGLGHLVGKD